MLKRLDGFWKHLELENELFQRINPFPNDKFETLPNWKSLQTTISSLMKMAEFSKWVDNTVGKGEIAHYEKFLLFPLFFFFLKDLYCRHIKTWACLGKG